MMNRKKVELNDVIGLIKTDKPTDSVKLKKEMYEGQQQYKYLDLLETEAISINDDECLYFNEFGSVKKVCNLLNKQQIIIKCLYEENIEFEEELMHQDAIIKCLKEQSERLEIQLKELRQSSQDYEDVVANFFWENWHKFDQDTKDEIILLFDVDGDVE